MNPSPFQTPINLDQHAFFVGTTGAGKTHRATLQILARASQLDRAGVPPEVGKILIFDTKPVGYGEDSERGNFYDLPGTIFHDWRDYDPKRIPTRIAIYRPPDEDISPTVFNAFLGYLRGIRYRASSGDVSPMPMTVVFDELTDIITSDGKRVVYLQNLDKLLRQGRSSLQTLWIETQYPAYIDATIKRLTTCRFMFRLPDPKDRKLMEGFFGTKLVGAKIPYRFGFWYQNDLIEATTMMPLFFTGEAA